MVHTAATHLTSRKPAFFSTAALAIASLTKISIYFPIAALASRDILVESLVKNSCKMRVSRSLGIDFSGGGASFAFPPRSPPCVSCTSGSTSDDSNGSLASDDAVSVDWRMFLVPLGRPRPRLAVPLGGIVRKHCWTNDGLEQATRWTSSRANQLLLLGTAVDMLSL